MIARILLRESEPEPTPKEGDLYKEVNIFGRSFVLRYGYYEDFERQHNDPMPIYPDFIKDPVHTQNGLPFVTKIQDACEYYKGTEKYDKECGGCGYYLHGEELLGVCTCPGNKKENT